MAAQNKREREEKKRQWPLTQFLRQNSIKAGNIYRRMAGKGCSNSNRELFKGEENLQIQNSWSVYVVSNGR